MLTAAQIEDLADMVREFCHAALRTAYWRGQTSVLQLVQSHADLVLAQLHDWVTAGALVASIGQCQQRERVVLRGSGLFFKQRAQHASSGRGEMQLRFRHEDGSCTHLSRFHKYCVLTH